MAQCPTCLKPTSITKFCSHTCSAIFNNAARGQRLESTKTAISKAMRLHHNTLDRYCPSCNVEITTRNKYCSKSCIEQSRKPKADTKAKYIRTKPTKTKPNIVERTYGFDVVGEYSTLCQCMCKVCAVSFLARGSKQYCNQHRSCAANSRKIYSFKFNVYHYPDLFDLSLLKERGWYSPNGKSGSWNPDGLSRDHKISISDAIKHNYSVYYITHPMNCELMPHKDNNNKKGQSSITFAQLKELVDTFDIKHKVGGDGIEPPRN